MNKIDVIRTKKRNWLVQEKHVLSKLYSMLITGLWRGVLVFVFGAWFIAFNGVAGETGNNVILVIMVLYVAIGIIEMPLDYFLRRVSVTDKEKFREELVQYFKLRNWVVENNNKEFFYSWSRHCDFYVVHNNNHALVCPSISYPFPISTIMRFRLLNMTNKISKSGKHINGAE